MGNQSLTTIYGESSKNVKSVTTEDNDPTLGIFIDHNTYPAGGLITCTQKWIQNFNWHTGEVSATYYSDSPIVQVDCNLESDLGSIIVIGTTDMNIKILNSQDLEVLFEINVNEEFSEDVPTITALTCNLERELVAGFSNGATMTFNMKEAKQNHLLIGKGFFDDLVAPPPVEHIKTSSLHRLIFISYADYWVKNNKVKKLNTSLILIFNWDTGEYVRQAMLPKMSIVNMGVIEDKNLLIMMTRGDNSIYVMDYTSCSGIAKLGDVPSSQMYVFPFSKATYQAQMELYNQAINTDALIYTSMDDGCICSSLIKSSNENDQLQWTWIPQHLYSTKESSSASDSSGLKILNSIWYNIILDILIVSDVTGVVYLVENTFFYTLKSNLKTTIRSDYKQPFFSLSSSDDSSSSQLSSESHVIKKGQEKNEKKPYFSFGFFKSSEPTEQPQPEPEEKKEEVKKPQKKSNNAAARKRVQINKNDILAGNYNNVTNKKETKSKVDNDKINEILARIERHTSKTGQQEPKQDRQSYGELLDDIKHASAESSPSSRNTEEQGKVPDDDLPGDVQVKDELTAESTETAEESKVDEKEDSQTNETKDIDDNHIENAKTDENENEQAQISEIKSGDSKDDTTNHTESESKDDEEDEDLDGEGENTDKKVDEKDKQSNNSEEDAI